MQSRVSWDSSKFFSVYDQETKFDNLMNVLAQNKNFQKDMINRNIDKIFSEFESTNSVIAYGEVQSGKTNNMIAAALYAATHDFEIVIIFGGTTNILKDQTSARLSSSIGESAYHNSISVVSEYKDGDISRLNPGKSMIITVLKGHDRLKKITNDLIMMNDLSRKVLIIDDECDNASINIESEGISKQICNIAKYCDMKYLGVSGTPYSNLLINSNILFPGAVVALERSTEYTGLDHFDDEKYWEISDHDAQMMVKKAVKEFIRKTILDDTDRQMVINIFSEMEKHDALYDMLISAIDEYSLSRILSNSVADEKMNRILRELKIESKIANDEFERLIHKIKTNIIILNSNSEELEIKEDGPRIFIGSNMLGRGITFSNLTDIILLASGIDPSLDTMLQRARWYGYRKGKEIKIFTNQKIFDFYRAARELDGEIRAMYIADPKHSVEKAIELADKFIEKNIKPTGKGGWNARENNVRR